MGLFCNYSSGAGFVLNPKIDALNDFQSDHSLQFSLLGFNIGLIREVVGICLQEFLGLVSGNGIDVDTKVPVTFTLGSYKASPGPRFHQIESTSTISWASKKCIALVLS